MAETLKLNPKKFQDPATTLDGKQRASVAVTQFETLWVNTGTLCNITCAHCYIESSPTNDRFVYFSAKELQPFLDEITQDKHPISEVGFTGASHFLTPICWQC